MRLNFNSSSIQCPSTGIRYDQSATATIPIPAATAPAASAAAPAAAPQTPAAGTPPPFSIPEAYKDRPYLKGVDSIEKVYSMLDGAQTMIGKRPAGIPAADAPQEEWDKFYDAAGRPKTPAEYKFEAAEGVKHDEKLVSAMQGVMHKAGLSANQAQIVQKGFDAALLEVLKEKGIQTQQQDQNFDALASKVFGADRDKVLAQSKALIDKHASPELKPLLGNLTNEQLVAFAGVLNNIQKTYIKEDGAPGSTPSGTGMTPDQISAEARRLMATPEYSNPFHAGHAEMVKKVSDLYSLLKK